MPYTCDHCGATMREERTADPYEDLAVCPQCGASDHVSWSREFGARWEESQRGYRGVVLPLFDEAEEEHS